MKYYVSKIVFQVLIDGNEGNGEFDQQIRLIQADSHTDAYHKMVEVAHSEEEIFENQNGAQVSWKFIGITDLRKLGESPTNVMLDSASIEPPQPEKYRQYIIHQQKKLEESLSESFILFV